MAKQDKKEQPVIPFSSAAEMRKWLEINHNISDGIWLQMYKKGSGVPSVVYAEALEEALCFGWIDGQLKAGDEKYYLQRFTPRRARSTWSKRNIGIVEKLEAEGRMAEPGWKAVREAMDDGRWDNAYDSISSWSMPEILMNELVKNPESLAFFESLDKINRYAIVWRIQSARSDDVRCRRLESLMQMLARKEKLHL